MQSYPSLLLYTLGEGTHRFQGPHKHLQPLLAFLSRHLEERAVTLWEGNWARCQAAEPGPWRVALCREGRACPCTLTRQLVGASLEGLARLGVVECRQDPKLCARLGEGGLLYYPGGLGEQEGGVVLPSSLEDRKSFHGIHA